MPDFPRDPSGVRPNVDADADAAAQRRAVSDLTLERFVLGELSAAEAHRVEDALASEPALRARLEALHADNAALLDAHPPEVMARRLQDRLRRERIEEALRGERRSAPILLTWLRPVAVGALLLAVIAAPAWRILRGSLPAATEVSGTATPHENAETLTEDHGDKHVAGGSVETVQSTRETGTTRVDDPASDPRASGTESREPGDRAPAEDEPLTLALGEPAASDTRIKGLEPALALFRKTARGAEPLQPGATAKPGDVLRIGYRAGGMTYGAIFSVDGNGNVTRHWPETGARAGRFEAGEVLLPEAFELDAAPDYERFYLFAAASAFDLKGLDDALKSGLTVRPPASGQDLRVVRFDLRKENGI